MESNQPANFGDHSYWFEVLVEKIWFITYSSKITRIKGQVNIATGVHKGKLSSSKVWWP